MMSTAKENNRSREGEEEDEIIPWTFVVYKVRHELIKKLNPIATMSGNDWRMLASKLGYTSGDINFIEAEKDNNTKVLFSQYDTKHGASFNSVYIALQEMQRQDCLDILNDALPEIKQAFIRARESQMYHAAETDAHMSGAHYHQRSNPPCSCTYSPRLTSACGSHTYCPCGHGFAGCVCTGHNHHLGHPSYHGHSLASHPCQTACQNFTHPDATIPNMSTSCHTSPKKPLSCHDRITQPSSTGYGYLGNNPASRINMPVNNHIMNHQGLGSLSQGHVGYYQGYLCNESDKDDDDVVLEAEPQNLPYHRLPLMQQNHGGGLMVTDRTAGAPDALMRNQVDNSNNLINTDSSNSSEDFNSRYKVSRQYSDECNITPDTSRGVLGKQQGASQHEVTGYEANQMKKPRNSQSPKFTHHSVAVSYTGYLDRHYEQGNNIKIENDVQCSIDEKDSADSPPNSNGSSWGRSHPSSTFPMRAKAKQDRALEDLKNLTIGKKSTSMPQNMKPREYRKAFRHIKVFVTYSYDNVNHAKQVVSLCHFLQDNGFACCVDVCEKKTFVKSFEQLEWCRKKVAEADFILACISNKYLQDIAGDKSQSSSNSSEHQLHTKEIYQLMTSKHCNGQHTFLEGNGSTTTSSPSFIPLFFPEITQVNIPKWMMSGPNYKWPEHYKDLAWMLTKPQERILVKKEARN